MGVLFGAPTVQRGAGLVDLMAWVGRSGRGGRAVGAPATPATSLRHSAVWGSLRLRADLISTLPVDVFRRVGGAQVEAPGSPLLVAPASGMLFHEWMYSTQFDLDRYGNCFGQIVGRDQAGWPTQVEPWPASDVGVLLDGMRVTGYRFGGRIYSPSDVWHERQYTVAGLRVGLSPIAYAAWSVGNYLSAQEFALDWYATGAHPTGTLRHTEAANLDQRVLAAAKERFKAAVADRDIFATGKEWEFIPAAVDSQTSSFLEQMRFTAVDVCRFIGVPATAIDAAVSGSSVTYANLSQNQMFLLVNHLAPAIWRREKALSAYALPAPRFVKFNSDALLRLDPEARTRVTAAEIAAWVRTPDEGRELNNLPPLTPEQIAQLIAHQSSSAPTLALSTGGSQ